MVSVLTPDQEVRVHTQLGQCVWRLLDLLVVSIQVVSIQVYSLEM